MIFIFLYLNFKKMYQKMYSIFNFNKKNRQTKLIVCPFLAYLKASSKTDSGLCEAS